MVPVIVEERDQPCGGVLRRREWIGGVGLYHRGRTIVLGAILGYVCAVLIGFALDCAFFMGQGHPLHSSP